ncbi:PREDICTED: regulator of cell cycle RGCC-like [Nanorana parkeri]|uniref:regulator of cell cycle RGCC-like n=1 Tax=Nanorana parkeri TaxID=125878 RepID=UPI0008546A1B|nr:PREDICTED: regulator of cell cycle RGCC-like [Nanorana parkeri]
MDRKASLGEDLVSTLMEFDDALQDFTRGPCDSEEHLKKLKQHLTLISGSSCDAEDGSSSQRSPAYNGEETLSHPVTSMTSRHQPKAKLGDTKELENFISDLDKVLTDF